MDLSDSGISRLIYQNSESSSNLIWGMPSYVCWIIIGILLVVNGMFAASENAFTNCNKYHFRAEADKGKKHAKAITYLVDKFDDTLVTILIMQNTIATVSSFLSALLFYQICQNNGWSGGIEAILSTVVMGFLVYIICDTIPKMISKAIPNQMARIMCFPLLVFSFILYPFVFLFRSLLKGIHKLFHVKDENILSKEDLLHQVDDAINEEDMILEETEEEPEKLFESDEKEILDHIMDFDKEKVRNYYTPLEEAVMLPLEGLTVEKINQVVKETEFSRLPIYDETKDNIIGILVLRIYFKEVMEDPHLSIPSILEPTIFLSPEEELDTAFHTLNSEKVHLGIVKEGDKVLGIITMEDILEQLVDDIAEDSSLEEEA